MERNATPHSNPLDENPSRDIINYRRVVWRFALSKKKKKKKKKKGREKENSDREETLRCYIFEIGKTTLPALIQFSLDSILVE